MKEFNRHDFINNTLRLEILGKLVIESLEDKTEVDAQTLQDYLQFTKDQVTYLQNFSQDQ